MTRMMKKMSNLSTAEQDTLMKYLNILTKLQDVDVKVNKEINDVVKVLHNNFGLGDLKRLSEIPIEKLVEELAKRNNVEQLYIGTDGWAKLQRCDGRLSATYNHEYSGEMKIIVVK